MRLCLVLGLLLWVFIFFDGQRERLVPGLVSRSAKRAESWGQPPATSCLSLSEVVAMMSSTNVVLAPYSGVRWRGFRRREGARISRRMEMVQKAESMPRMANEVNGKGTNDALSPGAAWPWGDSVLGDWVGGGLGKKISIECDSFRGITVDTWTTQVWTSWVHLCMDFFLSSEYLLHDPRLVGFEDLEPCLQRVNCKGIFRFSTAGPQCPEPPCCSRINCGLRDYGNILEINDSPLRSHSEARRNLKYNSESWKEYTFG